MKAEIDDDPRFRQRQKESPWRMFAISLASAAFIWAGIETFAKPVATNLNAVNTATQLELEQAGKIAQESINRQTVKYVEPKRTAYTAPQVTSSYSIERAPAAIKQIQKPTKQTSFNDQNYFGGREINTISLNEFVEDEEPEIKKPGKVRVTVIKEAPRIEDYCPGSIGSIGRRKCRQSVDLGVRNQ